MKKALSPIFSCSNCGAQSSKWAGRCTECGTWGSLKEDSTSETTISARPIGKPGLLQSFSSETAKEAIRHATGFAALDTVLGGGLVTGSVTLIAGEPGIGKSTLLAQIALILAHTGKRIVYVTGEESPAQISRRLLRLSKTLPPNLFFLNDINASTIAATISAEAPDLTIIDSIQTLHTDVASGEAGSVQQVKACAAIITEAAKRIHKPVILVGQVTKEGDIAGPRVLEHLVDTVLFLEGDQSHRYRILRALKHRFGSIDESAFLSMTEQGLEIVADASQELLRDRPRGVPGSAVTCLLNGHRALLIEVQALVSSAGYGTPARRATGIDSSRLGMLLAVLARRAGIQAGDKDVYANAAGGIDARDPSVDVAIAIAIAGAVKDISISPEIGLFGEIGLAGELRPVALPDIRLKELARLGFTTAIIPKGQGEKAPTGLTIIEVSSLREALHAAGIR